MGFAAVVLVSALYALGEGFALSGPAHGLLAGLFAPLPEVSHPVLLLARLGAGLGLLLAVRERVAAVGGEGLRALTRPVLFRVAPDAREARLLALALVVTVAMAWGARDLAAAAESPVLVGLGLVLAGVALGTTAFAEARDDALRAPGALLLGLASGLGAGPGGSRVGAAFVVLVWLGQERRKAAELALVVAGLAHVGGALRGLTELGLPRLDALDGGVAWVTGLVTATVAASYLRAFLTARRAPWLAAWLVPVGLAALVHARMFR